MILFYYTGRYPQCDIIETCGTRYHHKRHISVFRLQTDPGRGHHRERQCGPESNVSIGIICVKYKIYIQTVIMSGL